MKIKFCFVISAFLTVFILINLLLFGSALAKESTEEIDYHFDGWFGYHYADVDGSREKVGEYEVLDPGIEQYFNLEAHTRGRYFDLAGETMDKDDQLYILDFDRERLFQTVTTYSRFKHYLDHDRLSNQDDYTDFDAGKSNSIIREEIKSENKFFIPFLPGLKLTADYRQLNKRGHRQATTVSKCSSCHVTSRNRRINQTTKDIKAVKIPVNDIKLELEQCPPMIRAWFASFLKRTLILVDQLTKE